MSFIELILRKQFVGTNSAHLCRAVSGRALHTHGARGACGREAGDSYPRAATEPLTDPGLSLLRPDCLPVPRAVSPPATYSQRGPGVSWTQQTVEWRQRLTPGGWRTGGQGPGSVAWKGRAGLGSWPWAATHVCCPPGVPRPRPTCWRSSHSTQTTSSSHCRHLGAGEPALGPSGQTAGSREQPCSANRHGDPQKQTWHGQGTRQHWAPTGPTTRQVPASPGGGLDGGQGSAGPPQSPLQPLGDHQLHRGTGS